MIKIKTYKHSLLIGLFLITFCLPVAAQTSLQDINQSLRYSRYSRIALKVIPIKEGDRTFKLQMIAEKLEQNPKFSDYLFSYSIVGSFQDDITEEEIIPLEQSQLKYDTESHFYFEET